MSRALLAGGALAVCAGLAVGAPPAAAAPPAPTSPQIVVLRDATADPDGAIDTLARTHDLKLKHRYERVLDGFAADLTAAQLAALQADPAVAFVEPDVVVRQAGLSQPVAAGETVPPGVRRVGGVAGTLTRPAAAPVAVLDSGLDLANADLVTRAGINCVKTGTAPQDDSGHGTNVGGIIGARNSGAGVTGVAPGTPLYAVKVLGKTGTGTLSQLLCGINWVTANAAALGIRVANMSVTGTGVDDGACGNANGDSWHKAICASVAAGVTWVVSAGNAGAGFEKAIPAAYAEVLTVTAMSDTDGLPGAKGKAPSCKKGEADDRYAAFSSYATTAASAAHTIAAPGTCVQSAKLGGGISTYYGTSQAAPHVTGAAAACIGTPEAPGPCAGLPPAQVIARLRADATAAGATLGFSGDPFRPLAGKTFGPLVTASSY
jgi:subtilisin family serine protease